MKHRVKISLEQRKNSTVNLPIRIRVTFDGKRCDLYSGYTIPFEKWDDASSKVKHGCYNNQGFFPFYNCKF